MTDKTLHEQMLEFIKQVGVEATILRPYLHDSSFAKGQEWIANRANELVALAEQEN
tara:strand:+ start:42 stop:209 length:168 start_codon:yes stop_codon:yes gene_type:complete